MSKRQKTFQKTPHLGHPHFSNNDTTYVFLSLGAVFTYIIITPEMRTTLISRGSTVYSCLKNSIHMYT